MRALLRKNGKKLADTSIPGLTRIVYFSAMTATTMRISRPGHGKFQGMARAGTLNWT
jgi:hypothetical protein